MKTKILRRGSILIFEPVWYNKLNNYMQEYAYEPV